MEEIWKFIEGFDNKYEVSNLGRVRSHKTSKYLKPYCNNDGYLVVGLSKHYITSDVLTGKYTSKPMAVNLVSSVEDTVNEDGTTVSDIWSCSKKFINGIDTNESEE